MAVTMRRGRAAIRCRTAATAGFTLLELMVAVAIVALLASIAYPAYTNAVIKGKRGEGRTALTDLMQQQERYLTQTGSYGYNGSSISAGATGVPFKMFSGDVPGKAAYLLSAEACPGGATFAECVRVVATPQFSDPEVNALRIMSTGLKDCTGSKPANCWK